MKRFCVDFSRTIFRKRQIAASNSSWLESPIKIAFRFQKMAHGNLATLETISQRTEASSAERNFEIFNDTKLNKENG